MPHIIRILVLVSIFGYSQAGYRPYFKNSEMSQTLMNFSQNNNAILEDGTHHTNLEIKPGLKIQLAEYGFKEEDNYPVSKITAISTTPKIRIDVNNGKIESMEYAFRVKLSFPAEIFAIVAQINDDGSRTFLQPFTRANASYENGWIIMTNRISHPDKGETPLYECRIFENGKEIEITPRSKGQLTIDWSRFKNSENSPPEVTTSIFPSYPSHAPWIKKTGKAEIKFTIDPEGRVSHTEVVSATNKHFAANAILALKHTRFYPRIKNGKAISVKTKQTFTFAP